jgi:hypothetical protein
MNLVMMNPFSPDYSKRDYLLPNGCKDLIDLLRVPEPNEKELPWPVPPLIGEITIPEPLTVKELAGLLHEKPFKIVADLMQIGVFATVDWALPLEAIAKVARRYGYRVMRQG